MLDKVFGHHATGVSLNDRFTMLASIPPPKPARPRRRSVGSLVDPRLNFHNRNLIEQIARRLELQAKRKTLRQRLGVPQGALRRFGSESSLPGLRRAGSQGNLSQRRGNWRGSNGNLSRSASFGNLPQLAQRGRGARRGFLRRGARAAANRAMRGRTRGVTQGRVTRSQTQPARGAARGQAGRGRARGGRGRGRGRGFGRQAAKPIPSAEELDVQLDQYMAGSKSALDRELDNYMRTAMETDGL